MPARDDRRYEHSTAIGKPSESSIKHQTSPSQHGGIPDSPTMVPRAPEISSATPGPARLGRRLPERHHPPPTATAMPPAERPARHARFPASPRANAGMNAPRASHMREGLQLLASDRASRQSPSSPLTLMGPPCCSIILKESPAGPPSRLGQPPPPCGSNPTLPVWRIPPRLSSLRGRRRWAGFYSLVPFPTKPFQSTSRQANTPRPSHAGSILPSHLPCRPPRLCPDPPDRRAPTGRSSPPGMNPTPASRRHSDGTGAILAARGGNHLPW